MTTTGHIQCEHCDEDAIQYCYFCGINLCYPCGRAHQYKCTSTGKNGTGR